jgi:ribosomal protein L16 Arg81 hydroxylase
MDFASVLSPKAPREFFQDYWRQRPLLIPRSRPDYYRASFDPTMVEQLLIQSRLRYPEVRLVKRDQKLPYETLLTSRWMDKVVPYDQKAATLIPIYEAYNEGYTVVVRAEKVAPPVAALTREIEQYCHHAVIAELFLTPKGSQGSLVHTDPHDVFVLQLSGRKKWKVYDFVKGASDKALSDRVGPPMLEVELEAGDMMYVPASMPHEALTNTDQSSMHISIGVFPFRWRDLMTQALNAAMDSDPRFAEPLPMQFLTGDSLQHRFSELLGSLQESASVKDGRDRLATDFCSNLKPLPDHQFGQLDRLTDLSLQSRLEKRPGMLCHLAKNGTTMMLSFPGNKLKLPKGLSNVVEEIIDRDGSFTAAQLPGRLDEESRIRLMNHLLRAGLLRFSSNPAS